MVLIIPVRSPSSLPLPGPMGGRDGLGISENFNAGFEQIS